MAVGPRIRELLGPFERPVSEIYRNVFLNLLSLKQKIEEWIPNKEPNQILE